MPTWSSEAPANPRGPAYPLLRTPPLRPLVAIITSETIDGCATHYYKGRTVPHLDEGCPACEDNIPYRWHAYVAAYRLPDGIHFIFETTAKASEVLADYGKAHGGLRGCQFKATRMNSRPNSRVVIQTKPADLTAIHLPEPPNVRRCMAIIWDLPIDACDEVTQSPERKQGVLHPKPRTD